MAAKSTVKHSVQSPSRERVSMHEVAKLAGVSRSAVSLALKGHPSIPSVTRERLRLPRFASAIARIRWSPRS